MINRFSVTQRLVLSFVFVILVGSILLSLPISHYANSPETNYLDHLFNTVSMVCVTGLSVVPVSNSLQWFWSNCLHASHADRGSWASLFDCYQYL